MEPGNIAEMERLQLKDLPDDLGVGRLVEGDSISTLVDDLEKAHMRETDFQLHAQVWVRFDARIELSFSAAGDPEVPIPGNRRWVFEMLDSAVEYQHRLKALLRRYTPHIHTTDDRE